MPSPDGPDGRDRPFADAWSLLRRNRDFRLFFSAELISFAGDWFLYVALAGLIFSLSHSATLVSLLFVAYNLPWGFISFLGGPLADRLDRRRLMIVTDLVMGVLALGFFLVHSADQLWLAFALTAAISGVAALFEPAASAALPNLVEPEDLPAANILGGSAWGTMLAVGAGIGGAVVAAFGLSIGYIADAVSFFASAALLYMVRRPTAEPREPHYEHPGIVEATAEGLRYARRDRRVLGLLALRGGSGIGIGLVGLVPVLALQVFRAGDAGTGLLFAFRGIGSFIGPFLARPLLRRDDLRTMFLGIVMTMVAYGALYAAAPWMPTLALAGVVLMAAHMGGGAQWTMVMYGYQTIVPDEVRGRIFGFDGALLTFTMSASAGLAGWLAESFGVRGVMLGLGGLVVVYGLVAGIWTMRSLGMPPNLRGRLRRARWLPPPLRGPEAPEPPPIEGEPTD